MASTPALGVDMASLVGSWPRGKVEMLRHVTALIRYYEPRLTNVEVSVSDSRPGQVRLHIEAVLKNDTVRFNTYLNALGDVHVHHHRSGTEE